MPWPSQIEESEFTVLYEQGRREGFDVLLLDDWFQKDENTAPARFMLQPVTSRFPFYNDETEANKQRRKKAGIATMWLPSTHASNVTV